MWWWWCGGIFRSSASQVPLRCTTDRIKTMVSVCDVVLMLFVIFCCSDVVHFTECHSLTGPPLLWLTPDPCLRHAPQPHIPPPPSATPDLVRELSTSNCDKYPSPPLSASSPSSNSPQDPIVLSGPHQIRLHSHHAGRGTVPSSSLSEPGGDAQQEPSPAVGAAGGAGAGSLLRASAGAVRGRD